MTLSETETNKSYEIISVNERDKAARRLMDMGFTNGCPVYVSAIAPFGGAVLITLRGCSVALRRDAASLVTVKEYR